MWRPSVIGDVVIKHVGMPGLNLAAGALRYTDPEDPARQLEEAVHHAVHREERPQLLLIEVIMGPPEALRAVAELPGRKARRGPSRFARLRLLQLAALALERVRAPLRRSSMNPKALSPDFAIRLARTRSAKCAFPRRRALSARA
jgi:hypothetical protein